MGPINNRGQSLTEFLLSFWVLVLALSWLFYLGMQSYSFTFSKYLANELQVCLSTNLNASQCQKEFLQKSEVVLPWYKIKINTRDHRRLYFGTKLEHLKSFQLQLQPLIPLRRGQVERLRL